MKKFYITTSIAYTNDFPHLGFALESIQADVLARYHKIIGKDVFFLTGVDQHGVKIAKKAAENQKTPLDFVKPITNKFKELKEELNLSNNDFIETIDQKKHWPSVEKVWQELLNKGDIYKKKYQGLYCSGCEVFLKEKELIDNKCPVHKKELEIIEEENYFFKLSDYSDKVKELILKDEIKIIPEKRKKETIAFIDQGIEDISISRAKEKLSWGIPVPGDPDQVIYVWVDALTNYISALDYINNGEKFIKYWPADVHCIGKDIFRFHCLLWPAMLLSLDLDLPKNIFIHGFINVDGQKMSKSLGNVIDPFDLIKKYGTDPVRYYLLREIPTAEDGDFAYSKFEARYNSDLVNGIGNFTARLISMAKKIEPEKLENIKFNNKEIEIKINNFQESYQKNLEEFKLNEALKIIWEIISLGDRYIEIKKPWEKKQDYLEVIQDLLLILFLVTTMIKPFLPESSEKILRQLGSDNGVNFKIERGDILFPRIET